MRNTILRGQRTFWIDWIVANAWAELLGLGATFVLGYGVFAWIGEPETPLAVLGFILLMTSTGSLEGTIVGWLQWRVLRSRFAGLPFKAWWLATLSGALLAWFLGSLPSSIIGAGMDSSVPAPVEPPPGIVLVLASVMGMVLGNILALPQWRVLRRYRQRAWVWLPANGLAWAVGMVMIFAAIDLAQGLGGIHWALLVMVIALFLTGGVVGAIHGVFLVRLQPRPSHLEDPQ